LPYQRSSAPFSSAWAAAVSGHPGTRLENISGAEEGSRPRQPEPLTSMRPFRSSSAARASSGAGIRLAGSNSTAMTCRPSRKAMPPENNTRPPWNAALGSEGAGLLAPASSASGAPPASNTAMLRMPGSARAMSPAWSSA